MTVQDMILELQKHNPQKMVVMYGYEGGYDETEEVSEVQLKLNCNTDWYYGKHEGDPNGECHAILIS